MSNLVETLPASDGDLRDPFDDSTIKCCDAFDDSKIKTADTLSASNIEPDVTVGISNIQPETPLPASTIKSADTFPISNNLRFPQFHPSDILSRFLTLQSELDFSDIVQDCEACQSR
jgi:hypothetical protein